MAERSAEKQLLQWHQAFYAGMQIELEEEAHKLIFENEHQLGNKPMEIDVLIIKKDTDEPVHKNIGRIFRKHNIIEYKSPRDYISIDDYYKVYAYCWFYKADVPIVDSIKDDELTITFVSHSYPEKVFNYLKQRRRYTVEKVEKGIYHVHGDILPIQFIIIKDLDKEENLWLTGLTDNLKKKDEVKNLLNSYKENHKNPLYKSMMNIIVRANERIFEEVRGGMCEALRELWKDEIDKYVKEQAEAQVKERVEAQVKERVEAQVKEQVEAQVKEQVEAQVKERVEAQVKEQVEAQVDLAKNNVAKLMAMLLEAGRSDDILKAANDTEYQNKLLLEFGF